MICVLIAEFNYYSLIINNVIILIKTAFCSSNWFYINFKQYTKSEKLRETLSDSIARIRIFKLMIILHKVRIMYCLKKRNEGSFFLDDLEKITETFLDLLDFGTVIVTALL